MSPRHPALSLSIDPKHLTLKPFRVTLHSYISSSRQANGQIDGKV
jgi:hypothetical protein